MTNPDPIPNYPLTPGNPGQPPTAAPYGAPPAYPAGYAPQPAYGATPPAYYPQQPGAYYAPQAPAYYQEPDAPSAGFAVLGFFIPIVGLILFLVWHDKTPLKAKSAGKGALIAVIVGVAVTILSFVIMAVFVAAQS